MIAEAGLAALWLAAALSLLGLFLSVVHVRGKLDADRAVRSLAIVQGVLCLFAFAMLLVVFARTDLSVAAGRREQPQREALRLQDRRRLGEP